MALLPGLLAGPAVRVARAAAAPLPASSFEDGADGFTAPAWLGANAGQPTSETTRSFEGSRALSLPVRFAAGSYEQAGADKRLDGAPLDLTAAAQLRYSIYAPVDGLSSDLVVNDPWHPAAAPKPLKQGWNTVTFDLAPGGADFPGPRDLLAAGKATRVCVIAAFGWPTDEPWGLRES